MDECMWNIACAPRAPGRGAGRRPRMAKGARRLRQGTDRAIVGLFGGNLLEWGSSCTGTTISWPSWPPNRTGPTTCSTA